MALSHRALGLWGGALALVGALAVASQWLPTSAPSEPPLPVLGRFGGDFRLPATSGGMRALSDFRGRVVLLNFGFTSCPDICPTVLARLAQLRRDLGPDATQTQTLFVSFDPERDSIARLRAYLMHFGPEVVGFSASPAETTRVARQYGVVYQKEDTGSKAGYGFLHTDYIYLIDDQGRVRKLFATNTPLTEMARDVRRVLAERQARPGKEWF